jgi:hypothetical protein
VLPHQPAQGRVALDASEELVLGLGHHLGPILASNSTPSASRSSSRELTPSLA